MVRRTPQLEATREEVVECLQPSCASCGRWMWSQYDNHRRVRTLKRVVQLRLKVRRCATPEWERFGLAYRPEAERPWALPRQEFGLDVMVFVRGLRIKSIEVCHRFTKSHRRRV